MRSVPLFVHLNGHVSDPEAAAARGLYGDGCALCNAMPVVDVNPLTNGSIGGGGPVTPGEPVDTSVATVAALRSVDPTDIKAVVLTANQASGTFRWSNDTTTADDGAITVVPTALPRTGSWKRVYDGYVNVKWFGAVGDGVANDTDAIRSALAALDTGSASVPIGGAGARILYLPSGRYLVDSTILLRSGYQVIGESITTTLVATPGFTGAAILEATGVGDICHSLMLANFGFEGPATGLWGFRCDPEVILSNARISNIYLNIGFGLHSGGYAQHCHVEAIFSAGTVNQLVSWGGNHNTLVRIDKEAGTGTTTDPYVLIRAHGSGGRSGQIALRDILVQGSGSANKCAMRIENCEAVSVVNFWGEASNTNLNNIELENCGHIIFTGQPTHTLTNRRIVANNVAQLDIAYLATSGQDLRPITQFVVADSRTDVRIGTLIGRRVDNALQHNITNIRIDRYVAAVLQDTPSAGHPSGTIALQEYGLDNLFDNASFESGIVGWLHTPEIDTPSIIASVFGSGRMLSFVATEATQAIYQAITIPAHLVGRVLTFRAHVRLTGGNVSVRSAGSGVASYLGNNRLVNITPGTPTSGTVVAQFIPQSAGTMQVGLYFQAMTAGTTSVQIDNMILAVGTHAVGIQHAKSHTVNGQTTIVAAAIPTAGNYLVGDKVMYNTLVPGGYIGAVCEVAGSPGTWREFGEAVLNELPPLGDDGQILRVVDGGLEWTNLSFGSAPAEELQFGTTALELAATVPELGAVIGRNVNGEVAAIDIAVRKRLTATNPLLAPPASNAVGDRIILNAGTLTGTWAGFTSGNIAECVVAGNATTAEWIEEPTNVADTVARPGGGNLIKYNASTWSSPVVGASPISVSGSPGTTYQYQINLANNGGTIATVEAMLDADLLMLFRSDASGAPNKITFANIATAILSRAQIGSTADACWPRTQDGGGTGLYRSGANQIAFATSGSVRFVMVSSQNRSVNPLKVGDNTPMTTGYQFEVVGTSGVILPAGTNAQRPAGTTGAFRINTETTPHVPEFWDGAGWVSL